MNNSSLLIEKFWQVFSDHRSDFSEMESADDPNYAIVLKHLQKVSPDIYFEFMTSPEGNELIITADGERSLFPLVEEIIAAAPDLSDWTFLALKPQFDFPETTEWEGVQIRIADVRCILLECVDTDELGLQLIVPHLNPAKEDALLNALLRAIDHGLGERRFAESIDFTELVDTPAAEAETFPLAELDAELTRHQSGS
ncbi:MAG: hypothetical protein ACPGVU_07720 [Limisphaerales bacterium]